jgi:hypothetical protein
MRDLLRRLRRQLGELLAAVVVGALLVGIVWGLYWLSQREWGGNPNTDNAAARAEA